MANILLGIPSGGSVKSKTMMTIISVISMTQHRITVMERDGALGPDNRNHICQLALENGFTHVFLVDHGRGRSGREHSASERRNRDGHRGARR